MSRSSPSVLFTRYTDLYCEDTLESLFTDLFGSSCKAHLCLCVFWCIHVCVSLIFLFLVQSAVTEQAHVTPAGTGRASGPLQTLLWWDESTSVPSPHLLHRPGDGAAGGGGPRRSEGGKLATCSMICSVQTTCLTTATTATTVTSWLRAPRGHKSTPRFKTSIFSREVRIHGVISVSQWC